MLLDKWWSSLQVTEKERIASKIARRTVGYPECTKVWNSISDDKKTRIYEHVSDSHGHILEEWKDGDPFTD